MAVATAACVQAWIALRADDPAAVSAALVARASLATGRALVALDRWRLVELTGTGRGDVAALLHGSTQFYNPHKESCVLRVADGDVLPAAGRAIAVVWERGGERRPAAERWWRHESGEAVEVREAIVWGAAFAPGVDAVAALTELVRVRDARHGLLCNPWSQDARIEPRRLPWIGGEGGGR
jgi:hypothetical protein